ncbi:MAG: FIST N-terminal domain-containing protein [Candidatus Hinthialibacter antarcticus]|nr:FIST N-terminal domain-containing protein [Candidatus Hinthialibacter antarcticus]
MAQFAAASGSDPNVEVALDTLFESLSMQLDSSAVDFGVFFLSSDFSSKAKLIADRIQQVTQAKCLIGCNAESVIGPKHEYEREPAIALWLAQLPQSNVKPFHIRQESLHHAENEGDWRDIFQIGDPQKSALFLLGDPFSLNVNEVLEGLNQYAPGVPLIGGMASGAMSPGGTFLSLNGEQIDDGGVGVCIEGGVRIETVISQGCRPIGQPYIITQGEKNVITGLGGRAPLDIVQEMYKVLPAHDQELMGHGLFVGRVIDEYKQEFVRGDFLIRNLMGADKENGSIAVMDRVQVGATIQFHIRDAETADEDLRLMLEQYQPQPPKGVLVFSCNGRGMRMYSEEDHDLRILQSALNSPPVSGFFCAGEIGPIGGKNFIHGHTASMALFYDE